MGELIQICYSPIGYHKTNKEEAKKDVCRGQRMGTKWLKSGGGGYYVPGEQIKWSMAEIR